MNQKQVIKIRQRPMKSSQSQFFSIQKNLVYIKIKRKCFTFRVRPYTGSYEEIDDASITQTGTVYFYIKNLILQTMQITIINIQNHVTTLVGLRV